jgi:hypothetical protein
MNKPGQSLGNLDRAQKLSAQLDALLAVTTGEVGESFRILSDSLQNDFLWACSDMAGELANIIGEIGVRHE